MLERHAALDIIRDEHQALAAMLRSLVMMLAQARREGKRPDFGVLRAMLFYVDEFPERLHHPKESALLFPRLRERCPELAPVMARGGSSKVAEPHLLESVKIVSARRARIACDVASP